MITHNGKPVILAFFDGYDLKARPGLTGRIVSAAHFFFRTFKRRLSQQQVHTGFYVAFDSLVQSLRGIGCEVRVNDFAFARKHPDYPICMAGYPSVFERVKLPNPILFGPGGVGAPENVSDFKDDPQFVRMMQPSDWFARLFEPYCGDKMWTWYAGIDTAKIPDFSNEQKTYDFLVYDKIMWNRDTLEKSLLKRVLQHLDSRGKSYKVIRYKAHTHATYMQSLRESKTMIFLCEHETQGLAYQEALAAGVPVLAWDEGKIVDPVFQQYAAGAVGVSSVPYFDERCGERFQHGNFESMFDRFCENLEGYQPRAYVEECLSMEVAAKRYLDEYSKFVSKPSR